MPTPPKYHSHAERQEAYRQRKRDASRQKRDASVTLPVTDEPVIPSTWIAAHCSITIPGRGILPLEPYPYQVALWEDGARQRIVLKSRQMGVSRALACEAVYKAYTAPGSTILLVSRGLKAARNLLRYCTQSIDPAVRAGTLEKPSNKNTTEMEWKSLDSRIVSLPASQDAARSYSATDVYLDEAAYLPWAEEIYQALAPTVSQGGRMTVVSTPHGRGNLFHRLWECEEEWSQRRVHWSERPEYTPEWAEQERKRHTSRSWAEEYELSFEDSGKSVFAENYLQALFQESLKPAAAPFFAGLDLARSSDYTALAILDSQGQLIHLERFNQAGWKIQVERVAGILSRYPGVHTVCDASGVGDPVFGMLQEACAKTATPGQRPAWSVEAFVYTSESRSILMESLVLAVETPSLHLIRSGVSFAAELDILLGELRAFQWENTATGRAVCRHPQGGQDDCIQALALAWKSLAAFRDRAVRSGPALITVGHAGPMMRRGISDDW